MIFIFIGTMVCTAIGFYFLGYGVGRVEGRREALEDYSLGQRERITRAIESIAKSGPGMMT